MSNVDLAKAEKIASLGDNFVSRYLIFAFHVIWQSMTTPRNFQVGSGAKLCPGNLRVSLRPGGGASQ